MEQHPAKDGVSLADAEKQHGSCNGVTFGDVTIIVKAPTQLAFKRMSEEVQAGTSTWDTQKALVTSCLVTPSLSKFEELIERRPALVPKLSVVAIRLGEEGIEDLKKG